MNEMYESIEKAFDCKKLCFLYIPFAGTLHVKILCDDLRETFIVDDKTRLETNESRTFNDIDNYISNLPPNVFPFRRLFFEFENYFDLFHVVIKGPQITRSTSTEDGQVSVRKL